MPDLLDKLVKNAREYAALEQTPIPSDKGAEGIYAAMRERASEERGLMLETNKIIDGELMPVINDPQSLSGEKYGRLRELALSLFNARGQTDMGIAHILHSALLKRCRHVNDKNGIIFHCYWLGMILLKWCRSQNFKTMALEAFSEAAQYKGEYFAIEDKDTRLLINKCVGNVYVALSSLRNHTDIRRDYFSAVQSALEFWHNPKVRALDPDFPFDAFELNAHQNTCAWLDELRKPGGGGASAAKRIYDSAVALYGSADKILHFNEHDWPEARRAYVITAANYHAGKCSIWQLVSVFTQMVDSVKENDYSAEAMYKMLHVAVVVCDYLKLDDGVSEDEASLISGKMLDRVLDYCQRIPSDTDSFVVNNYLSMMAPSFTSHANEKRFIQTVLRLTTFRHLPTFVHSVMVGKIMKEIAAFFISEDPSMLIGMCGASSVSEVLDKWSEILDEVELAGLSHDVGKIVYLNTVTLCSRRIFQIELNIIKEHADSGYEMFKSFGKYESVLDVIRGHHKSFDGQSGYPGDFDSAASKYKFIIDIASVADSLDAATDGIGRSYALTRTLDYVLEEILEQAGTRYSPVVANAVNGEYLKGRLNKLITQDRARTYFNVYSELSNAE